MRKKKVPDGVAIVNLAPEDGLFLVPHPAENQDELADFFVDIGEFLRRNNR